MQHPHLAFMWFVKLINAPFVFDLFGGGGKGSEIMILIKLFGLLAF